MLRMRRSGLVNAAGVSQGTIMEFEARKRQPHPDTLTALRTTLEAAGVEFIAENGGGAGVRLRNRAGS